MQGSREDGGVRSSPVSRRFTTGTDLTRDCVDSRAGLDEMTKKNSHMSRESKAGHPDPRQ